jgi:hypothetical protein
MTSYRNDPDGEANQAATMQHKREVFALHAQTKSLPMYSEKVDNHIYGIYRGCETNEEWAKLAIAALDQAGLSIDAQNRLEKEINSIMEREKLLS